MRVSKAATGTYTEQVPQVILLVGLALRSAIYLLIYLLFQRF